MSFLLWRAGIQPGYCVLAPTLIDDVDVLDDGTVVPADFSQPIEYRMSDDFPDDIQLGDNFEVADRIIVSNRLQQALAEFLPAKRIQYLPVKILNHKKRVAANDYAMLHPHDVCDCIDVQASKVKWNALNRERIFSCKSLVIRPESVAAEMQLFRPKHWAAKLLVRESLAKSLLKQGFVGLRFADPAKYRGVG
jgi:hypothetical protein